MKRLHAVLSGRVQGVFFRDFVKKRAFLYRIKGFVKNTINGSVEIIAEGEESNLKKFIEECRQGPSSAEVEDIELTEEKPTGEFEHFSIQY